MQLTALFNSVSSECDSVVTVMRTLQDDLIWDTCVARLIDGETGRRAVVISMLIQAAAAVIEEFLWQSCSQGRSRKGDPQVLQLWSA